MLRNATPQTFLRLFYTDLASQGICNADKEASVKRLLRSELHKRGITLPDDTPFSKRQVFHKHQETLNIYVP